MTRRVAVNRKQSITADVTLLYSTVAVLCCLLDSEAWGAVSVSERDSPVCLSAGV